MKPSAVIDFPFQELAQKVQNWYWQGFQTLRVIQKLQLPRQIDLHVLRLYVTCESTIVHFRTLYEVY